MVVSSRLLRCEWASRLYAGIDAALIIRAAIYPVTKRGALHPQHNCANMNADDIYRILDDKIDGSISQ
jgi:regulator of sirC expression with transglutaminase-like and TPR domain